MFTADCPDLPELHGKTVLCDCDTGRMLREERARRLLALSDLPARFREYTLDSYEALNLSGEQPQALSLCRAFLSNGQLTTSDGRRKRGLFLHGPVGTGKSGLAAALCNEVLKYGVAVVYRTVPDLLDYLRSTFNQNSEVQYDDVFERIKAVDLLVLDDLGTETPTPWVLEKLFQIIDFRYRYDMRLLVTSNYSLESLMEHFDRTGSETSHRLVDRLAEMCAPVQVQGTNLR